MAHARATQSIENCVDAGIDAIAHVEFLSARARSWTWAARARRPACRSSIERVAEKVAASPAYLDLNPQSSGWDTRACCCAASSERRAADLRRSRRSLSNLERYFDHFIPVIGALRELGLVDRMGFGSDAGPFDTEFGHLEYNVHLARLAGLSPMESLQVGHAQRRAAVWPGRPRRHDRGWQGRRPAGAGRRSAGRTRRT